MYVLFVFEYGGWWGGLCSPNTKYGVLWKVVLQFTKLTVKENFNSGHFFHSNSLRENMMEEVHLIIF